MTATLTEDIVQTNTSTEPEQVAHIVSVPAGESDETPQAYVMRARVEGFAITAWCGHTWVPSRDPKPLPVCQPCLDIYRNDPKGHGDRGELPDA